MRLSDLITFVRLAAQPYDDRPLVDADRLAVFKAAFPRPDLLSWFDARLSVELPAAYYVPVLLIQAAAQLSIRHQQIFGVHCASQPELSLIDRYFEKPPESLIRWETGSSGEILSATAPQLHQVGQITGFFTADEEISALKSCLSINFYHAQRLLFLSDRIFDRLNETSPSPISDLETFRGLVQDWNGQKTYLLYVARFAGRRAQA